VSADVFLGGYRFAGDPSVLAAAYDRLLATYPVDQILLHVCVVGDDGIVVYDACPSREVFDAFSQSPEFAATVKAAGLPAPTVVPLGHVRRAVLRDGIG
jgi:hypothetical protein